MRSCRLRSFDSLLCLGISCWGIYVEDCKRTTLIIFMGVFFFIHFIKSILVLLIASFFVLVTYLMQQPNGVYIFSLGCVVMRTKSDNEVDDMFSKKKMVISLLILNELNEVIAKPIGTRNVIAITLQMLVCFYE